MEAETKFKVEERVMKMLDEAEALEAGTKERSAAVEDVNKLLRVINEEDRNVNDFALKADQMSENEKVRQQEEKERKWTHGLAIASIGAAIAEMGVQIYLHIKGMQFEETGSVNSFFVRQNAGKLFRKHEFKK